VGPAAPALVAILETEDGMTKRYAVQLGTFSPGAPGSKKTVRLAAAQLLIEPGKRSFVVIDPKGQIAAITANDRSKVHGSENVKVINPYGLVMKK
jgi:ribosome biogenesis protein Tsr3